jgi:D-alanyl-D-alanine carboxypeptidase/D-alanyl-D-alanine-endopeptidase (penicillin-binding protein 4)
MKKNILSTALITLLLLYPIQAQEIVTLPANEPVSAGPVLPVRLATDSETKYLKQLALKGFRLEKQGILIESLDSSTIYAELNSDVSFNPASVIKVATSMAALYKFGADYQFKTGFYSDGIVNKKTRTLNGNLVLVASGDPTLTTAQLTRLVREVIRSGITKVNGNLIVAGPFSYGSFYRTNRAMIGLTKLLRKLGVRVSGSAKPGPARGMELASHVSDNLRDILFFQNAHSSNPTAERLGEAVGGPKAVERFLVEQIGIAETDVQISHTSGLAINRITPRATIKVFRELVYWLNLNGMTPQDILPVAGIDVGTLRTRFTSLEYRGGIIGKTGTLPGTDGGVSTLAGILYTRDKGPILFAIFNTKGSVTTYRRMQDEFLKKFIAEYGGIPEVSASLHRSSN